jgi:hypothetical protein
MGNRFAEPAPAPGQRAGGAGAGAGRGGAVARTTSTTPALSPSAEYAGTYYSDEIDATFTVRVREGQITVQRETDAAPIALLPAGTDQFRIGSMTVRFVRSDGQRFDALLVDAGRVRDIRFMKR